MPPLDDSAIERILFVTAHPDDLDFGAGGTIAQWSDKGIEISYYVCTNGDQGGVDPSVDRSEMPKIRQQEQRDAGKVLGVSDIHFLNYVDGHLVPTIELRKEIVRAIRKVRPQRMVIQNPERNWERIFSSHPDHMAAAEAAHKLLALAIKADRLKDDVTGGWAGGRADQVAGRAGRRAGR